MKKTIFRQFLILFTILSIFLVSSISIYFFHYLRSEQFRIAKEATISLWTVLSADINESAYSLNSPLLNNRLSTLSKHLNADIYIYDNKDRIITRYIKGQMDYTDYEMSDLEKIIQMEIKTSMLSATGEHFNLLKYFVSGFSIMYQNEIKGYFVVVQEREKILASFKAFRADFIIMLLIIFTISMIFYIIYIKGLVNSIIHLKNIASQINIKNMDIPIIHSDENEIGELADQFKVMSSNLKVSIDELNFQKEMLLSIMNFVNQAIWIIDDYTKIQLANTNFEKLVNCKEYFNVSLFNLIRNPDIIKIYQDTLLSKSHITREIEFQDKIYLCTSSFLHTNKSIIFTMLDISEIKSVEKIKKDIISNVSHELKTPLTSIKGFVETLLEDANTEQANYLEIVQRNTDRLISIVNDILTLSKLENNSYLEKEEINLKDFFNKLEIIFTEAYKDKEVNISFEIPENTPNIKADEFMLEQVFINLVDNAVKYGGKDEIKVAVSHEKQNFTFSVTDKGIGIPPEHQKRVFERFYVVDRNRSKRMGGTGLGLSIVKHIVNLHNGDIFVESESGKGTTFKLEIRN